MHEMLLSRLVYVRCKDTHEKSRAPLLLRDCYSSADRGRFRCAGGLGPVSSREDGRLRRSLCCLQNVSAQQSHRTHWRALTIQEHRIGALETPTQRMIQIQIHTHSFERPQDRAHWHTTKQRRCSCERHTTTERTANRQDG